MFDIGFWELVFIAVMALLIVGPQRLPGVAAKLGTKIARVRGMIRFLYDDFEKMAHMNEVNELTDRICKLECLLEAKSAKKNKEKQQN